MKNDTIEENEQDASFSLNEYHAMRIATILKLASLTGTDYCHRAYCGCGGDEDGTYPNLLFTNVGGGKPIPDWLPSWANGSAPQDLYPFVQEQAWHHPDIAAALSQAGLKRYTKFRK